MVSVLSQDLTVALSALLIAGAIWLVRRRVA
jgi:hypothetical protein